MIDFYLAARFGRREELCGYAESLKHKGYGVTSRWLTQHQKADLNVISYSPQERQMFALHDYEDVLRANRLIAFTEDPAENVPGGRRGGRHVELGIALTAGKHVYVVGHKENVFCHLPSIMFYATFKDLYETLEKYPERS